MNRLLDFWFTAEMLALVDPASDIELEMLAAAKSLDPPEQTPGDMPPSYAILSDKFERFAALNAGIRKALEWRAAQDVLRDATTAQSLAEARAEYARPKPTSGKDPARLRSATAASMARAESAEVRGAISEIHRPP